MKKLKKKYNPKQIKKNPDLNSPGLACKICDLVVLLR